MNKITKYIGFAVLAAGLVSGQNSGQMPSPPDPATMVQRRVSMLTTLLSLTNPQQTQATRIFTNAVTAAQAVRTNLQTQHQSLAQAIKTNSTATIDSLAQTIGTLEGQMIAINAKAEAAFYALLTADQQTKYESMPHGPGMGPGGRGGAGPMGHGGPPR